MRLGFLNMIEEALIIDVDDMDFQNNKEDLGAIISRIDAEINGLF